MGLAVMQKQRARTPEAMAKWALKQEALKQLAAAKLPDHAIVRITYGGHSVEFKAEPTVTLKNGQVLFHHGGKMPVQVGGLNLEISNGGNLGLGLAIEGYRDIVRKYAPDYNEFVDEATSESADAEMEAGESVE